MLSSCWVIHDLDHISASNKKIFPYFLKVFNEDGLDISMYDCYFHAWLTLLVFYTELALLVENLIEI